VDGGNFFFVFIEMINDYVVHDYYIFFSWIFPTQHTHTHRPHPLLFAVCFFIVVTADKSEGRRGTRGEREVE